MTFPLKHFTRSIDRSSLNMTNRPASLHLNVSHWAWSVQKSRVIYYSTAISCHKYISNGVPKWGIHIQSLTDTIIIMIGIGRAPREVQFPAKSIRYKTHGRRNMGQRSIHRFRFQSIIIIAKAHSVLCCGTPTVGLLQFKNIPDSFHSPHRALSRSWRTPVHLRRRLRKTRQDVNKNKKRE